MYLKKTFGIYFRIYTYFCDYKFQIRHCTLVAKQLFCKQTSLLSQILEKNLQLLARASTSRGSKRRSILSQISSGTENSFVSNRNPAAASSDTSSSIMEGRSLYNVFLVFCRGDIEPRMNTSF